MRFATNIAALTLIAFAGAGCSVTPSAGPTAREIEIQAGGSVSEADYLVVDLNQEVIATLTGFNPLGLSEHFARREASLPDSRIGVGDTLSVSIWEAGEGGLFSSGGRRNADFPQVVVDRNGKISLPYAGVIEVKNRTPLEVQQTIVKGLSDRAIQPQVVVAIAKNESNTAVVSGDVANPGRYGLSMNGDRLLDVVAAAGGTKFSARETYVTFMRGQKRGSVLLEEVVKKQDENIYINAGDRIYLSHEPRKYTVFGAVPKPGVYAFESPQVNLLEAIAAAGGPLDNRADSTGLFLFRYETREFVQSLRPSADADKLRAVVPVVYRVSLRDPNAYFIARGFRLRDKDVLYAANAEGVEISKVLRLLALGSAVFGNGGLTIGE